MSSIDSEEILNKCTISNKTMWDEIQHAKNDKRHELILSGTIFSQRIKTEGLDPNVFHLENLNYLNVSETILENLSEDIGLLKNLTNLVLHSNRLTNLPNNIGELIKLKILDVSRNCLKELPDSLKKLDQLVTLNASQNLLTSVPCLQNNTKLATLDLSYNKFTQFPEICYTELNHLLELKLNNNEIQMIPCEIKNLVSLKHLELNDNHLEIIPGELNDLHKLKELNLKQNRLKDKRFSKLIDQSRNTKQIFDYIKQHCIRSKKEENNKNSNKKTENNKVIMCDNLPTIKILKADHPYPYNIKVVRQPSVKTIRPFIICCIIRDIEFNETNFKSFIQLQTKLHEDICEKRQAGTIATHDLEKIISLTKEDLLENSEISLFYEARAPDELKIKPLGKSNIFTGKHVVQQLQNEANALKKEKKRNVYSGTHKYLYLVEGQPKYACLTTSANEGGLCISFPPITNCEETKITLSTKNIFIEITSNRLITKAREICDELIIRSLKIFKSGDNVEEQKPLTIQQVKIINPLGELRQIYPNRTDFKQNSEQNSSISFKVLRDT